MATAAAVTSLTLAASAYLNGKYHIAKDLRTLSRLRKGRLYYESLVTSNRQSLWYPFEEKVRSFPESEQCLWSASRSYTWRQAYDAACQYSYFLREECGVEPGELVSLCCQNSTEFVLSWLGMWGVGCAPAMINYNLEGEGLVHCLKVAGARVVLVDGDEAVRKRMEAVRSRVEGELGMRIVVMDEVFKGKLAGLPVERPGDELRSGVKGTDTAMLLFTSGTTGFPKATAFTVMRSHPQLVSIDFGITRGPGPNTTRWYVPMPLYHGTAGNIAILSICGGFTLCIGRSFSASRFWDEVRASDATAFVYVGETARYLLARPESSGDRNHRCTLMFGNGLRPDVWQRFVKRFGIETVVEFFNSSEGVFGLLNVSKGDFLATAVGHHGLILRLLLHDTYIPVEVDHDTNDIIRPQKAPWSWNPFSSNTTTAPVAALNAAPTDLTTSTSPLPFHPARRLPYATGGELLVRIPTATPSDSGFSGYYKNPTATSKKYATGVFKPNDLFYRSGDALRRDAEGRWYFVDRLGDTFRWKSENVSTAEVAHALGLYKGITEAIVYGVALPAHEGRAGCAAICLEGAGSFDFKGLHAHLRKHLPRYAVPVFLRIKEGAAGEAAMHNQKQNKVPLRLEGVDLGKINLTGDRMMWVPPGGEGYVEFGEAEWKSLQGGLARL